jgi:hypothetical protein
MVYREPWTLYLLLSPICRVPKLSNAGFKDDQIRSMYDMFNRIGHKSKKIRGNACFASPSTEIKETPRSSRGGLVAIGIVLGVVMSRVWRGRF